MARSRNRSNRATSSRANPRRSSASTQADEPEEGGMGLEAGIGIITTLTLLAAILFLDYELGTKYGGGIFFGG